MKKVLMSILCIVLIATSAGCNEKSEVAKHPSNYATLSEYIGKTKDDIFKDFDLKDEDEIVIGTYLLSEKAEFLGESYNSMLAVHTSEEEVYQIMYTLSIEDDMERAVETVSALQKHLKEVYGEKDDSIVNGFVDQNDWEKAFSRDDAHTSWWNLTDEADDNIKEYIKKQEKENPEEKYSYILWVDVHCDGESQVAITIDYKVSKHYTQDNL